MNFYVINLPFSDLFGASAGGIMAGLEAFADEYRGSTVESI